MRSTRIGTALVAGVAVAACLPPAANAQAVKKFNVTASASQVVDWNQPRSYGVRNCSGVSWVEGSGTEKVEAVTPRKTRVLAYKSNRYVYFEYNSWRRGANPYDDLHLEGHVDRSGDYIQGRDGGPCANGEPGTSNGPYDCARRARAFDGKLSDGGGKLKFVLSPEAIGYPYQPFSTCPLNEPAGVTAQGVTTIDEEFDARTLLKARKPVVVRARQRIQEHASGPGSSNSVADIRWTVKFSPVK
jgi:hypothetical protein